MHPNIAAPRKPSRLARLDPSALLRLSLLAIVLVSAALVWFSAGDHALYSPDEGRYASVSRAMADGGSWLVPAFRGEPHLTKPPLIYWLQAASMRLLGDTELAARAPSALAASLVVLLVWFAGRREAGPVRGALAAGVLSITALFLIVSRFALTDSLLNLFWLGALVAGVEARRTRDPRWTAALWTAAALGMLTKGPIALIPVGLVLLWTGLAEGFRGVLRLKPHIGLPLAVLPVVLWGVAIAVRHPDALRIWWSQSAGRFGGAADHAQPWWWYAPVFLVGLFPATAMLNVPGWNYRWRDIWPALRAGRAAALWAMAIIVPLAILTLMRGKLITYLLPLCAPLALLTAETLHAWLDRRADAPAKGTRPPEVVGTLTICAALLAAAAIVAAVATDRIDADSAATTLLLPAAAAWTWWIWKRRPSLRAWGLAAVWASFIAVWLVVDEVEDAALASTSGREVVRIAVEASGAPQPTVITAGMIDPALDFYAPTAPTRVDDPDALLAASRAGGPLVVVADEKFWSGLSASRPDVAAAFEVVARRNFRFSYPALILRPLARAAPVSPAAPAATPTDDARPPRTTSPARSPAPPANA